MNKPVSLAGIVSGKLVFPGVPGSTSPGTLSPKISRKVIVLAGSKIGERAVKTRETLTLKFVVLARVKKYP